MVLAELGYSVTSTFPVSDCIPVRFISLTLRPWTTTMDYRNGLPKWTAKWTTKMDYLVDYPK